MWWAGGWWGESQCAVSKAEFGSIGGQGRQGEYKRIFSQALDRESKSDFFFFNMFIFK